MGRRHPVMPPPPRRRLPGLLLAVVLVAGVLFGVYELRENVLTPGTTGASTAAASRTPVRTPAPRTSVPRTPAVAAPVPAPRTSAPVTPATTACATLVSRLSDRDRLAQRLMVGADPAQPERTRALVAATHVGGVFVGGNPIQIFNDGVLAGIKDASPNPVSVAVDDEGGRVQRIDALDGDLPSARAMGRMTPDRVRGLAADRGARLAELGVTIDFAPVLDVGGRPDDDVIGDRSFGTDPDTIVSHAGAFADGLTGAGIRPVFKHFPGHGRASGDSHQEAVRTPPLASLRGLDLVPFTEAAARGDGATSGIMVGHLDVPDLTRGVPASLSPDAYQLLRDTGFRGVTFTDDLSGMRAVTARYPLPQAVSDALHAGADVALVTTTQQADVLLARLDADLRSGRLDRAANDAAVARILRMDGACR